MKGQTSYPFSLVEASFTFLLLMSVVFGAQVYTEEYFREETLDIRADRVENAAFLLQDYPAGDIELDIDSFEYYIDDETVYMQFGEDIRTSRDLSSMSYSSVEGPDSFEEFESLCLRKNFDDELVLEDGC